MKSIEGIHKDNLVD